MVLEQKERFVEHGVDIEQRARRLLGTAEIEHALDDAFATLHFVLDQFH